MLGTLLCDWLLHQHPFFRSYGVILPSSLTMLLPFVLGSSPHLPVSVCGTGIYILDSHAFLASVILDNSLLYNFHYTLRYEFFLFLAYLPLLCHMRFLMYIYSAGIFCLLSIGYAFRPHLRSRLTLGGRTFPRKPETFDGKDSHLALATYSGILSSISSSSPFGLPSSYYRMLLYHLCA